MFFWLVVFSAFKNTDQKNTCASIVLKTKTEKKNVKHFCLTHKIACF